MQYCSKSSLEHIPNVHALVKAVLTSMTCMQPSVDELDDPSLPTLSYAMRDGTAHGITGCG